MVADPAAIPVTIPVVVLTVAIPEAKQLQEPPLAPVLESVVVAPTHALLVPSMEPAFGSPLMVTVYVAEDVPHAFDAV
jgi:hypothetical protein